MTYVLDKSMESYLNIIRKVNMLILVPELLNRRFSVCPSKFQKVKVYNRNQTCDFLPKPQVQASQFQLHISYFLQKCKKGQILFSGTYLFIIYAEILIGYMKFGMFEAVLTHPLMIKN